MTKEELRELFSDMLSKDMNPMLCDTEVNRYETSIPCGDPTMCSGSCLNTELLPKELLSMHPEFLIKVKGDSMIDAGIVSGDSVRVICDVICHDGDIVLACIDGEYTLKTYCEDEEGQKWLVPQNDNYMPILLDDKPNVRIYGKVMEVVKPMPRVSYRDCMKIIKRAKQLKAKKPKITEKKVEWSIRMIADKVKAGRQWYAPYRALVDKEAIAKDDFSGMCGLVKKVVPNHKYLPTEIELRRMDVQSFRKPLKFWDPLDAPVNGKRFMDYLHLGQGMLELLEGE